MHDITNPSFNKSDPSIYDNAISYFKWLILDDIIKDSGWVAGGCVRDYFMLGSITSDVDVFSDSRSKLCNIVLNIRKRGGKYMYKNNRCIFMKYKGIKIDIVKILFKDMRDTIDNFDFTVSCGSISVNNCIVHDRFFVDLASRKLIINKLPYPLSTLHRVQKYIKKGFSICDQGLLTIAKALHDVDFSQPTQNTFEFYPDGQPRFVRFDGQPLFVRFD